VIHVVVLVKRQDEQTLSATISLKQCIIQIQDSLERTFAFRLFNKYPIRAIFDEDSLIEWLVSNDFKIMVCGQEKDATNLALGQYDPESYPKYFSIFRLIHKSY